MLILTRKAGQKIYIGEGIILTVVDIDRGKVRLGIDAPPGVTVARLEVRPKSAEPPRKEGESR